MKLADALGKFRSGGLKDKQLIGKKDKPSSTEEVINTAVDQALLSSNVATGEASQLVEKVKTGIVDPLLEFAKEHPTLSAFIGGLATGGLAGLLEKKSEEKKEMKEYLENVQKFADKVERKTKFNKVLNNGVLMLLPFMGGFGSSVASGVTWSMGKPLGLVLGLLGTGVSLISASIYGAYRINHPSSCIAKDGKCLKTGDHNFVTLPPSGDKVIFCKIIKDNQGNKPVPEQEISLNPKIGGKPTYITIDKDKKHFYVNYENGVNLTKFTLDGKRLEDIVLFPSK